MLLATAAVPGYPQRTQPPDERSVEQATRVKDSHIESLMRLPAVVAVGVGAYSREPGRASIHVYVSRELKARERKKFPRQLEGVPVEVIVSGPIRTRKKTG